MTRSLRGRLLLSTAIGAILVLSAAGVILYLLMRASLLREFDASLLAKARALAALVEQDGDRVKFEFENLNMPEFERPDRPEYFQVWRADGSVLARSKSLSAGNLDRLGETEGLPAHRSGMLPDGRRGRQIGIVFRARQEDEDENREQGRLAQLVALAVACETAGIDRTLTTLALLMGGIWAVAIAVMLGVLAVVVRRGLRPAEQLANRIGELDESDLSARIELADAPDELMPVIQRLNDLLRRMDDAFTREKAFSADVAHELRTPLAGLRTTLEVGLAQTREPARYREALSDCLGITQQMQAMVDNLLWLARAEAGQLGIDRESVDLAELLSGCWQAVAENAQRRSLHVEWQIERPCVLATDREMLRQALHNILDNAVTHADTGGRIRIEAGDADGRGWCRVANTGSRLTPQQVQRVFDRFWRGDEARADTGMHFGLGLSLTRRIVALLGGAISADVTGDGLFVVEIRI